MNYSSIRDIAKSASLAAERSRLRSALSRNNWSPKLAAAALGVSTSTLYRAVERHQDLQRELSRKAPSPGRVRSIK